jgi:hypothetical protein
MTKRKPAKKATPSSVKRTTAMGKTAESFTVEERAAMRERVQELKATKSRTGGERWRHRIAPWASGSTRSS